MLLYLRFVNKVLMKVRRIHYILGLVLLLAFSEHAWSGSQFRKLSTSEGLSNRRVLSMTKGGKGYYWFATRFAVDRFDGDRFVSYRLSDNEKIRGVIADNKGRVYAFTEKSIYIYNESTDSFRLMARSKQFCPRAKDATINTLHFDSQNRVWVGAAAGVYFSSNFKSWYECKELRGTSIFSFADNGDGAFWIGTGNGVLQMQQLSNGSISVMPTNDFERLRNIRIQSLYYDKVVGKLWIGTFSQGLFTYSIQTRTLATSKQNQLNTPPVRSISRVSDTEVWVGYDGLGIFAYDRFSASFQKSYTQANTADLGSNSIYFIYNEGNSTWVCTYTAGVFVQSKAKTNYRNIIPNNFSSSLKKSDSHVNAILEDSDGDIWFGTNNGVSILNPATNTWKNFLQSDGSVGRNSAVILSFCEDRRKNIWVGGFATDLICINKRTGQVRKVDVPATDAYHTSNNYIYSIVEDSQGYIWFGGVLSKLIRYDVTTGKCLPFDIKGINKIVDLNATTLMLGTVNGAYLFDKRTGKHRRLDFSKLSGRSDVVPYPFINNIVRDAADRSVLWIGTDGNGLYRFSTRGGKVSVYTSPTGLSSSYVYGILFDQSNRLWVSTENGLNCLSQARKNSVFTFDGFTENTYNFLAYCKLRNGDMIWGTPAGALLMSPERMGNENNVPFNLRFNHFYIYYEKVVANGSNSPLEEGIDQAKSIVLGYNQRSFSFDFFNVGYPSTKNIVYSWKLEGFDEGWSTPSSEHKAVYTNMPSGRYTFLVKAINTHNGKESEVRRIEVRVLPPFWASPLAYLVYALLLVGVAWLLSKLYRNKVETQNSEEKINFFVNMAHDIRIPITLIKAPLNEIEQETLSESGSAALKLAQRNTQKLFSMVSQLLDFQKVGLSAVGLNVEETSINNFVNEVFYNFSLLAKEKGITIDLTPLPEDEKLWVDRQKVSLVLENLLSNAIKYTNNGGNVHLKLSLSAAGWLTFEVVDDGIGIPSNVQDKIFNRFFRANNTINSNEVGSGIGLLLTKKLVTLHKGKVSFASSEKVGTTFKVELPAVREAYSDNEVIESEWSSMEQASDNADNGDDKLKILYVEDNDELRAYLSKLLSKDFKVEQASSGEEALQMVMDEAPDFILSDVIMPKMSGIELCSKLKSNIETCHIPIILLTSLSDREDVINGLNAGADDYITKPFDLTILTNKIKNILHNRSLFKQKLVNNEGIDEHDSHLSELDKEFLHKVISLVEENMSKEEFSIETLSSELAMSRSVFFKKLKALTGQSPVDLVKDIRMKKAAELLREKRYSVNEIAYLTGFPNPKYFSTAFKKYYGNTPTGFLEKDRKDKQV